MTLNRDHAEAIAAKLGARIDRKRRGGHALATIYYEGKRVTSFGIRHGSRRDQSHAHIPRSIYVSPHEALRLARCPMSFEDWVKKLRDKGKIEKPPPKEGS